MKPTITLSLILTLLVSTYLPAQSTPFSKKSIQQSMKAAMQWQLAHTKHALNDWTNGAFYTGITQAWLATKDKDYLNDAKTGIQ